MIDMKDVRIAGELAGNKSRRKLYRCYCDSCGADRGYKRSTYKGSRCRACANKKTHTGKIVSEETKLKMSNNHYLNNGNTHPWIGRKHSKETIELISSKQKEYCLTHENQFLTGYNKGKHSLETISVISAKNMGKEPQWKGRTFQYDGPKGKMKMRSSYEIAYALWMDSQGIQWEYEPKFKLSNGKMFAPDFRVGTNGIIVEVKGYFSETGKVKWELFCKDYPEIEKKMLFKRDLEELGIKLDL